jgi:DNA-binding LacI/PurR family transcriptional regulator
VLTDNAAGGRLASEHLIGLGHRRLGYFGPGLGPCRRYDGCAQAALAHGLASVPRAGSDADLAQLLAGRLRPTGLVTYADRFAARAKHIAEQSGLRIPRDLSLVGFDNMWFTSLPEFELTTVAQPQRDIGRVAMEMLLARIRGQAVESRLLPPSLVVRRSTAEPGRGSVHRGRPRPA